MDKYEILKYYRNIKKALMNDSNLKIRQYLGMIQDFVRIPSNDNAFIEIEHILTRRKDNDE